MSAIIMRGALSRLGLLDDLVSWSPHVLSSRMVYAPEPGNCFRYLASASIGPGDLFFGINPLETFLGEPDLGMLYPYMPKSSEPFLVKAWTISLGDNKAVMDADLIGLTRPVLSWKSFRDF